MKNKKRYAGIIILIAIILAGQAFEPKESTPEKIQSQPKQQYIEVQDNTTENTANATNHTPEVIVTETDYKNTNPTLPNCTGSYGVLIKTNNTKSYSLWDLGIFADSIKIYSTSDSATAYKVYSAKKLSGPWLRATEDTRVDTENSTIAIYRLPGTHKYIKVVVNGSLSDYEVFGIEKCVGGGNGNLGEKVKYIDAVESLGKGRGGCGCDDPPHCTTTTTSTTTSSSSTTTTEPTTTTSTSTTTMTKPTTSSTTTSTTTTSTTTTEPTTSSTTTTASTTTSTTDSTATTASTSTTTTQETTTTSTTASSTTTTTIPNAPEFSSFGGVLASLLLMPAFSYLIVRRGR